MKPQFHNPPTPQHEAVLKEKEAEEAEKARVEVEAPIQAEIKREIEEVEGKAKTLEEKIMTWLFILMAIYTVGSLTLYVGKSTKKYFENSAEIEFAKANPKYVKAVMEWKEKANKETNCGFIFLISGNKPEECK